MTKKERLIEMIETEPELLKIIQSKEYMKVLEEINKKPPKIEFLKSNIDFKNVSILYNILDTLIQTNFIKKILLDEEEVYYLTDKGQEFVSIYIESKEKFDLNGGE